MFFNRILQGRSSHLTVTTLTLFCFVLLSVAAFVTPVFASDSPDANAILLDPNVQRLQPQHRHPGSHPSGLHNIKLDDTNLTIYIPAGITATQSVQVLFVLHGMGGNGLDFIPTSNMLGLAQQNHLLLVAPTFKYNPDYLNASIVTSEDAILTAKINHFATGLASVLQLHLKPQFLLYGFSRGAQLAHRFALLYPQNTLGVAALSAGCYTLPLTTWHGAPLNFAFGVNDLQNYAPTAFDQTAFNKVSFLIAVGADDTDPTAVSPDWTPYEGINRLERAQTFYNILKQQNMDAQLVVSPNTGHQISGLMNQTALALFKNLLTQH